MAADKDKEPTETSITAKERREIPGGFPYTTAPGVLAKALARILECERPTQFSYDFLYTVIGVTGGSARAIIPILKRTGFLAADGSPTERYGQFQSQTKRANAALEALKTGWSELFRRNRYANRLNKNDVDDLFVEVTGLKKSDQVFRAITSTYGVFREYAKDASPESEKNEQDKSITAPIENGASSFSSSSENGSIRLGLSNQINIILPETTDINVYHSIFKALKESLLT